MERITIIKLRGRFFLALALILLPLQIVTASEITYHQPPAEETIGNDRYSDDVRMGLNIFTRTNEYAGRYSGNKLSCSNCHLDKGRRANAAPLWGAFGMYPAYRSKNDQNNTLQERIQQCFRFSLDGFAPRLDSAEIKALTSYIHFLSRGIIVGKNPAGRGFPVIQDTGFDPNPDRGRQVYIADCASCHGKNGEGQEADNRQIINPPLWGLGSYNKGSGFYQNQLLAGFILANMPVGNEGLLTEQQALDVAAYINLQIRPRDPRLGFFQGILD